MAAARRPVAWVGAAALLLAACNYGPDEPGLFPTSVRSSSEAPSAVRPAPTNPELPVAGERLWVSSADVPVTVRIAVHAVRRVEGATVLDWSVTPVSAPGYGAGDLLPATDLGLEQATRASPAVTLVDVGRRTAYQPLVRGSREEFEHCLCTPWWRQRRALRVGETRLLQIAFPALPDGLALVDVSLIIVAPFRYVPVSPVGTAPAARRPTDLARPAPAPAPAPEGRAPIDFANPARSDQYQRIQATRVLAAPGRAALEWTLTSVDDQRTPVLDYRPPVESRRPPGVRVLGSNQASGPVLRLGALRLDGLWARSTVFARTAYECQCTELGQWAAGLRTAGGSVTLVTNFTGLPAGTRTVDVEFPGFGILRGVPVVPAEAATGNLAGPRPAETGRWAYAVSDPPEGWSTADWPTDVPDPARLADYTRYVEPLVTLPAA